MEPLAPPPAEPRDADDDDDDDAPPEMVPEPESVRGRLRGGMSGRPRSPGFRFGLPGHSSQLK